MIMDLLDMPAEVQKVMRRFFSPEFDVQLNDIETYVNTLNQLKDIVAEEDFGHLLESLFRMTDDCHSAQSMKEAFEKDEVIASLPPSLAESLHDMIKEFGSQSRHPLKALPIENQNRYPQTLPAASISGIPPSSEMSVLREESGQRSCSGSRTRQALHSESMTTDGTYTQDGNCTLQPREEPLSTGRKKLVTGIPLQLESGSSIGAPDNWKKNSASLEDTSCHLDGKGNVNATESSNLSTDIVSRSDGIHSENYSVIRGSNKKQVETTGDKGGILLKNSGSNCIVVGVKPARHRNRFILPKISETTLQGGSEETTVLGSTPKKTSRLANKGTIDVAALCGGGRKRELARKKVKKRKKTRKKKQHGRKKAKSSHDVLRDQKMKISPKMGEDMSNRIGETDAAEEKSITLSSVGGHYPESQGPCLQPLEDVGETLLNNNENDLVIIDEVGATVLSVDDSGVLPKNSDSIEGNLPPALISLGTKNGQCVPTDTGKDVETYTVDDDSCCCKDCWKEEVVN